MATLEKIRSRSVLLLVIIAVALLAFILGDFLTSGRSFFGTGSTVASIGSHKIDAVELRNRIEEATKAAQAQGRATDHSVLEQQVIDAMVAEALFNEEIEKLGITVTDDELTEAILGRNSAYADRYAQQAFQFESAAQFHDVAFNPSKYQLSEEAAAQMRTGWTRFEKEIEEALKQAKFQNLFMGTLVANDLDARSLYDDNASTAHIAYAKSDYSALPDDKYAVTDDDIKALYNERRNLYRLEEPSRLIDYISVEIAPSPDDQRAAAQKVAEATAALAGNEGTTGLEGMNQFVVTREKLTRRALRDAAMKSFIDSAAVGSTKMVSHVGNTYTLAKLLGRSVETDSINVSYIAIRGTAAEADSLRAALAAGKPFAEAAAAKNVEESRDSIWVTLTAKEMANVRPIFEGATDRVWFSPDTVGEAYRLFRVNSRRPAVAVYDLAQAVYVVEPSASTVNKLEGDLARFLNENATAADFAKNAAAAGYNLQTATVGASTPRLGMLDDTREGIAWAMDAKKGQVSGVMGNEAAGRFVAVAVEDIYDDDFRPVTDPTVRAQLEARARNNMKAGELMRKYEGKATNVQDYATLMGSTVDSTTVSFGQIFIPGMGMNESSVAAATATAKPGQLVGPIQANNAVVVLTVTSVDNAGRPFNAEESSMQFQQTRGAGVLARNLPDILRGNRKVKNNSLQFYNR